MNMLELLTSDEIKRYLENEVDVAPGDILLLRVKREVYLKRGVNGKVICRVPVFEDVYGHWAVQWEDKGIEAVEYFGSDVQKSIIKEHQIIFSDDSEYVVRFLENDFIGKITHFSFQYNPKSFHIVFWSENFKFKLEDKFNPYVSLSRGDIYDLIRKECVDIYVVRSNVTVNINKKRLAQIQEELKNSVKERLDYWTDVLTMSPRNLIYRDNY